MPAPTQFMHVESYSKVPSRLRRRNGHRSAAEVIDEIKREPHACPHVEVPAPPTVLVGDPSASLARAVELAEKAVDPLGRSMRRDAHILAGCVCSYPVAEVDVRASLAEQSKLTRWINRVIEWANAAFGAPNIGTIVLHRDESMPHLHIILVPTEPGIEPSPLRRASKAAVAAAADKTHARKIERQAYKDEAIRLQDSFHRNVSVEFGHLRLSNAPRKRLSPKERQQEKKRNQAQEVAAEKQKEIQESLDQQQQLIYQAEAVLRRTKEAMERELAEAREVMQQEIHRHQAELELKRAHLEQRERALDRHKSTRGGKGGQGDRQQMALELPAAADQATWIAQSSTGG